MLSWYTSIEQNKRGKLNDYSKRSLWEVFAISIEMLKYIESMTCCCGNNRCKNKILPLCQSVDDVEAHMQSKEDKNNSIIEDRIENCPVRFQKLEINR